LVMDTSVERHFQQHFIYRRGGKFYWWKKTEYKEKTTVLQQATEKLDQRHLYRVHLTMEG
jgi:hypothetical protein